MKGKEKPKHTFTYREQYDVIVLCKEEVEQRRIYEHLKAKGLNVRVVTV